MTRHLTLLSACFLALFTLAACEDQDGPAEEFGESMDESVEELGDSIEDAGDELEDSTQ